MIIKTDVLLVGAGIMSATLGMLLKQLHPQLHITMIEKLDTIAGESSDGWNNAGTGHAGYCELNYTPQNNGLIEIDRALKINAQFELSLQFWASLVKNGTLDKTFINQTPHISLVWGKDDIAFLKARYEALSKHHLFADMQYSEDFTEIATWMPLITQTRSQLEPIAATRVAYGSDIDFGNLTRQLIANLQTSQQFNLQLNTKVQSLKKHADGWHVHLKDSNKKACTVVAQFVFLGAGGGALPLLQKANVPESKGYGGFPVSGQWLVCNQPEVVKQHKAKVYGKAAIGAPPMSVPHLDTRIIDGEEALLFGPFAGFTTKFLKQGSFVDLIKSVKANNLKAMFGAGKHNMDLTRYLLGEVFQTQQQRLQALRNFYPAAKNSDWHLSHAGKRVQIIKNCDEKGGKLEFGTEIVASSDGSIATLLGASPGASVSVSAMLDVLNKCFAAQIDSADWQEKLTALIPSNGLNLIENAALLKTVRAHNLSVLNLNN